MVREARQAGQTVLLSSHILSEIQHAADDVAVLAAGSIVARGDVASLRLASVSRLRAVLSDTPVEPVRAAFAPQSWLTDIDIEPAPGSLVRLTATLHGEADPLVKVLANFTVRHLAIEEPDLEESILDLYARTDTPA